MEIFPCAQRGRVATEAVQTGPASRRRTELTRFACFYCTANWGLEAFRGLVVLLV